MHIFIFANHINIGDVENPVDSSMHLLLTGLLVLEHLKLVSPVQSTHRVLWSVISWSSPLKALMTATLDIQVYIDFSTRIFLS